MSGAHPVSCFANYRICPGLLAPRHEIFRKAHRAAIASKQDPELVRIIEGIKTDLDFAKQTVRAVGVSGYRKHLEAQGYKCKLASLKRALVATGIDWAKHRKAKPCPGK
jgi:hypothetical protein